MKSLVRGGAGVGVRFEDDVVRFFSPTAFAVDYTAIGELDDGRIKLTTRFTWMFYTMLCASYLLLIGVTAMLILIFNLPLNPASIPPYYYIFAAIFLLGPWIWWRIARSYTDVVIDSRHCDARRASHNLLKTVVTESHQLEHATIVQAILYNRPNRLQVRYKPKRCELLLLHRGDATPFLLWASHEEPRDLIWLDELRHCVTTQDCTEVGITRVEWTSSLF